MDSYPDDGPMVQQIDTIKLGKLDKLLVKIDNDFKKKSKDISKPKLVEIMKTTHEIYQIVLYEISEMLECAKLSDLRQILNKIYNGQNTIINYILKLNTNFEISADKMLENLQKNVQGQRRKSFGQKDEDAKENKKMAESMVSLQPKFKQAVKKTYAHKQTDTGDDMREARDKNKLAEKEAELLIIQQEIDEEGKKVDEFLKKGKADIMAMGESKAQNNLKDVLKDLGKKRREAEEVENDAQNLQDMQADQKNQMSALQGSLIDGIKNMQKHAQDQALKDVKAGKAVYKNGELVYLESVGIETDKNYFEGELKERFDKLKRQLQEKEQQVITEQKKAKDIAVERDVLQHQLSETNNKLKNLTLEKKKYEEKKVQDDKKKTAETTLKKDDQDKIKRLVEDNIKMKMRIKTLLDNIKDLEKELARNFERFKAFINNSNLPDDMKKAILSQAENLFKLDISSKLNVNEMKELLLNDDLLKDPMFKNIIGTDIAALTRQVRRDEQQRKARIANVPNYDPEFDPNNLGADEKIITRKVKKLVKRQNSKGEWITEEIEVEEEVVINTKTGEEIRKRDKPITISQSADVQNFLAAHGGMAIGGSKINLPKKPMAKDGKEVKMGEWFEDKDGRKVRKIKGKDGEEVYEVEETYVDENGVKRTRVKQMKIKKDKNGNEIIEEEQFGRDGKKINVQKRVVKDKDGAEVTEEVTVDEFGNKILKRQKVIKDKDGNEVTVEEIIDAKGNKTTVKRKVIKDANGNDIIVEERIDADGNKIITTKRIDEFGREIIEEEIIDKYGNVKKTEKKVMVDADGNPVIEEVTYDQYGNKIVKRTKVRRDADGNEIIEEEIIGPDGKKQLKTFKKKKNADGSETIEEEYVDENGNTILVKKRVYKDKDGNIVTEEEKIDTKTGQRIVTKTKVDRNGKAHVEQKIIDKDGKVVNIQKTVTRDAHGNLVETETRVGEDGKKVTIQRKVFKDKDGKEVKEEIITDEHGNQKIVRTKVLKDKDGNDIIEETTINADGTKTVTRRKVYKDKDGNEIIEEERVDQNGNKIIVRTKKGADGEDIVEEIRIGADGKQTKTIKKMKKDKNGNMIVEETTIGPDGKKVVKITRMGIDDKQTQTDFENQFSGELTMEQLLEQLAKMGVDKSKIEMIKNQIMLKQKIKENKQKKVEEEEKRGRDVEQQEEEKERQNSADSQNSLETLDDGANEDEQADKLYDKMMQNKFGGMADLIRQVRNALGKQGNEKISLEEFKEYLEKMRQIHQKCGENCPHLKRFYEKLGFIQKKYKRRFLRMKDTKIEAKQKLPQIQTPAKPSQ